MPRCDALIKPTPIGESYQVASLPPYSPWASCIAERADELVVVPEAQVPSKKPRASKKRRRRRATALLCSELPDGDSQRASQVAWYEEQVEAERRAVMARAEAEAHEAHEAQGEQEEDDGMESFDEEVEGEEDSSEGWLPWNHAHSRC